MDCTATTERWTATTGLPAAADRTATDAAANDAAASAEREEKPAGDSRSWTGGSRVGDSPDWHGHVPRACWFDRRTWCHGGHRGNGSRGANGGNRTSRTNGGDRGNRTIRTPRTRGARFAHGR